MIMQKEVQQMEQLPADTGEMDALLSGMPPHTGALVLAAAAAALNRRRDLEIALRYGLGRGVAPQNFYEALLQLYLFAGFPAALEALAVLRAVLDELNMEYTASSEPYNADIFRERGEVLCRTIYTTAYEKMRERVGGLSPDLDEWMVVEGYGKTLSRPGLPIGTRELVTVAVLSVLGWRNQLYSHIRGAVNAGADRAECEAVLHLVDSTFGIPPQAQAFDTFRSIFA